jgi:hypothetical protein
MPTPHNYETVSEAVNDLQQRGYTADFSFHPDKDALMSKQSSTALSHDDFDIDAIYRFEGDTDPGDEMIIFAISSKKDDVKGIIVNAYGVYADANASKIVALLTKHL